LVVPAGIPSRKASIWVESMSAAAVWGTFWAKESEDRKEKSAKTMKRLKTTIASIYFERMYKSKVIFDCV